MTKNGWMDIRITCIYVTVIDNTLVKMYKCRPVLDVIPGYVQASEKEIPKKQFPVVRLG